MRSRPKKCFGELVPRSRENGEDEVSVLALRKMAMREQKPIKQLASEILKQRLRAG